MYDIILGCKVYFNAFLKFKEGGMVSIGKLLDRLFGKENEKPKAAVFVDYEHWYISLDKNFHIRPDIESFIGELNKKYDVADVSFFGNFSNTSLNSEMHRIRGFTNKIVETDNGKDFYKKDYTDFIILDHIYQSAYTDNDIDTYVIFTGDGHFSSVVLFLKNVCKKNVEVYGVKGAFSGQLKQAATSFAELPNSEQQLLPYCRMIIASLFALETENKKANPAFIKTVKAVSEKYNADEALVKAALEKLMTDGYISQYVKRINNKSVKLLKTDYKRAEKDGLLRQGNIIKPL